MSTVSMEVLIAVAALILAAVAAGTICARLFMAATHPHPNAGASSEDV